MDLIYNQGSHFHLDYHLSVGKFVIFRSLLKIIAIIFGKNLLNFKTQSLTPEFVLRGLQLYYHMQLKLTAPKLKGEHTAGSL